MESLVKKRGGMAVLTAALLLGGCATLPQKSALPARAAVESIASVNSFAAPDAAWPSDHWWEDFGDAQLSGLIAEGLVGATDLRVAEARFARAQALVGETRSRLLPSLNANAEAGATKQSYNYLFPREFAPQGWPDYGVATLRLDWELAAAYADLGSLHAERDAAARAVEVRGRTLELMEGRKAEGLENAGAVERARSALATSQGELAALDEALVLARNRIAVLLGAGPDRGLTITRPAPIAREDFGLPANLPAELIGRRPDIIAARLRSEAAASRIKEARAAFYPNINLAGLIGLQALGLDNVFKSGSEFGTVGPAISLPIFDGGSLRGRYRASEADYREAVAQYDGALIQALREIADAAASERALGQRLDRARDAERAASAAWAVANNRYRGGLATSLDVLVAEDALISTRRTVATLQARAFALDVALARALGGGFRS